jgi:cyclic pyranopterin phosphate synthase
MAFKMIDVGGKAPTARRARASGAIKMSRGAYKLVAAKKLPKGDVLSIAEIAGLQGAKRCADLLPLCHPLPLDSVAVTFTLDAKLPGVRAACEASAFAKTGVEMEALAGVNAALLCCWDLVKQVDPNLEILDVKLDFKKGGKSDVVSVPAKTPAAVVVVSDSRSKGKAKDETGPLLVAGLKQLGFSVDRPVVVGDDKTAISMAVRLAAAEGARVIVTTGGTGLGPRDVTPEALRHLFDREVPGIGEAMRNNPAVPGAALSRSVAGQLGDSLVVCLPGSKGGVRDGLKTLAPLLPHALHVMKGGGH